MKKFGVGIQLYGVRDAMAKDFEGTLSAIKDMGYEYVELAGYYGKSAKEIKEILDRLGLKCVSAHQALSFFDEDPSEKVAFLKTIGVKYVIVPWYERSALAGTDGWENTVKTFERIGTLLKENGMTLGYHNHDFEFLTHEGKTLHDHIFDALPYGLIVPELDTCWIHYAGFDPAERIRAFAGRAELVHLKDFTCKSLGGGPAYALIDENGNAMDAPAAEDNGFRFSPLGGGRQNFAEILSACEQAGTEIVIVEQDEVYDGMTELEAARVSREYLKTAFGL